MEHAKLDPTQQLTVANLFYLGVKLSRVCVNTKVTSNLVVFS